MNALQLKLPKFLLDETAVSKNGLLCPAEASRVNNLDFIRFFLAVSVIFCHCYVLYYGTEETVEPLWVFSNRQISIGSFAVNFFFTISGFLILQSWNHSTRFVDFLRKRVMRIFPAFIAASLVCVFIFAPLGTADSFMPLGYWKLYLQNVNLKELFLGFVQLAEPQVPWTLNSVPIHGSINAPMWTIRYEFFCYLLIPVLFYLGVFKKKAFVLAFFLLAFATQAYQSYQNVYFFGWQEFKVIGKPDFFPRFFTYFAAGMCFYVFRTSIPRSRLLLGLSFAILLASTCLFKGLVLTQPIVGSYILFYFAFSISFSVKDFAKSGDFSYGVYMYAWPIQQLVILYFEKHLDITLMFILSMIFTMMCAYLSWHYIEKPFLSMKSKKKTAGKEVPKFQIA
jgi:peptidoglycan/LPS O-acetylase OafA/YrhL